ASPTATARFSRATGLSVRRTNSSYHSTICTQLVSCAVRASACSAAMAAWAWNSPSRSRVRAACSTSTPSATSPVSHRAPGVVKQHEREQARDLLMVDPRRQLASEPDRLGGENDVTRVALVEDQVE